VGMDCAIHRSMESLLRFYPLVENPTIARSLFHLTVG
jgi:hypothetical protein